MHTSNLVCGWALEGVIAGRGDVLLSSIEDQAWYHAAIAPRSANSLRRSGKSTFEVERFHDCWEGHSL